MHLLLSATSHCECTDVQYELSDRTISFTMSLSKLIGILQPPQNQYVLAGTKAIINCEAYGETAYWIINGTALTSIHFLQLTQYEAMGITFANTSWTSQDQMNYNLTMTVPTYLECAVRNIICVARDRGHRTVESGAVNIFVLQTLRKLLYGTG